MQPLGSADHMFLFIMNSVHVDSRRNMMIIINMRVIVEPESTLILYASRREYSWRKVTQISSL